ncbi:hypothetical protein AJ80_08157 [Polytolypa hystricis UAMH7299]|uniref:Bacteriophage T5 Orf172 DNA-binding domain-containing protein n=1 Tax=Polytolypa hystricis (strain UAMH7299) TaxID=1447883 RepID=A0A2B7XCJ5_POLH7|nr:hypothetical protein AJ80_08157 [Polytolypa hystricis UAMH7299]
MSEARNTPEFRLARTDSKDPATTCHGIKADGQRCRRTVGSRSRDSAKAAIASSGAGDAGDVVFCWQHKDQAAVVMAAAAAVATNVSGTVQQRLKNRSSIDTLVEIVGLLNVSDRHATTVSARQPASRPEGLGEDIRGERQTSSRVDEARRYSLPQQPQPQLLSPPQTSQRPDDWRRKRSSGSKFVCVVTQVDDDEDATAPAIRVRPQSPDHRTGHSSSELRSGVPMSSRHARAHSAVGVPSVDMQGLPGRRQQRVSDAGIFAPRTPERGPHPHASYSQPSSSAPAAPITPPSRRRPVPNSANANANANDTPSPTPSQTESLLSWIPTTLSPKTTCALLKELSDPLSDAEEAGYIYVCWVTPQLAPQPSIEVASSLIPTRGSTTGTNRGHRTSEIMRSAGVAPSKVSTSRSSATPSATADTIILKIGRTTNVHRRMKKWSQQCAHRLTLMRSYPYSSFSPSSLSNPIPQIPSLPRKVPHTHKVERLIQLELADRRVKLLEPCGHCDVKHKEWFEIRAETEYLRIVDECVRRWVRWSESVEGGV